MTTFNEITMHAPLPRCFAAGSDVERWPDILPHYRKVKRVSDGPGGRPVVRMEAVRHFGPLPYPIWWESRMEVDEGRHEVHYHHVRGITSGMDVLWRFESREDGRTRVVILHEWEEGPGWPLIGKFAARRVIGPWFVHVVAGRTLSGVKRAVEQTGAAA